MEELDMQKCCLVEMSSLSSQSTQGGWNAGMPYGEYTQYLTAWNDFWDGFNDGFSDATAENPF